MGEESGHGRLTPAEVGALAGVSGTTVGQWARWGLIAASVSAGDPHVYSAEDAAEAAIVAELLRRGIAHADVHRAIGRLGDYGRWPLAAARLATTPEAGRTRIALREAGEWLVLGPRGWQAIADGHVLRELRLRLRHDEVPSRRHPEAGRRASGRHLRSQ